VKIRKAYRLVPAKGSKMKNVKTRTTFKGQEVVFDSKLEAMYGACLEVQEREGKIFDLERQVRFTLLPVMPVLGYKRPLVYVADFVYWTAPGNVTGNYVIVDVKGHRTRDYLIKKRLMEQLLGLKVTEEKK
jgi:hypothetical protein